jgi:hypothetical protein
MPHYFDDVYIIAPLATAKVAFSTLAGLLPEDHMELNMTKTQLYCPAPPNSDSWKRARAAAHRVRGEGHFSLRQPGR